MRLRELLSALPGAEVVPPGADPEIRRVTQDSRSVAAGDLFVAIRGEKFDGARFVADAIARGAVAVVGERPLPEVAAARVFVSDARRALALLAYRRAGDPAARLVLAGVTGTNGKTTTTALLSAVLARRHGAAGFVGTTGYRVGTRELPADRTTPDAVLLAELLARMVREGIPAAAMEVSSHALALGRVEGCRFDLAVFTNLTRDHLDFHRDMESYFAAKRRLFAMRKASAPAVVNAADPYGRRLAAEEAPPVTTYAAVPGTDADVRAENARCDLAGTSFDAVTRTGRFRIESSLLGRFNVDNLLAAAAGALALGMSSDDVAAALASVRRVPGRLEPVNAGQPYTILVDYAHTDDALRRLLLSVRELTDKKIVLVFGCGGDRDTGKREPMGRLAGELADIAIATSDNPRTEDPEKILDAVERGLAASGATKYLRLADRRDALRAAIDLANPGTVVVIAGKGHETTQVIGAREEPFDDRAIAAELAGRR